MRYVTRSTSEKFFVCFGDNTEEPERRGYQKYQKRGGVCVKLF